MSGPLSDITVLDLSRYGPGLFATMMLADLGATVIRVEEPRAVLARAKALPIRSGARSDREQMTYAPNRNKRSIIVDLKRDEGRQILYDLVRRTDVLYEGYRPGVTTRLGIDYDSLRDANPRIVYCSLSGYGQRGPDAQRPAHDLNFLAISGALLPHPDAVPRLPSIQIADFGGGSLHSLVGVLSALHERDRTGQGQFVDAAILDGVLALTTAQVARQATADANELRFARRFDGDAPSYNLYRTSDARWIAVCCNEQTFWAEFCSLLGIENQVAALAEPDLWADATALVAERIALRSRDAWEKEFERVNLPCMPVLTHEEARERPHMIHRGAFAAVEADGVTGVQVAPTVRIGDFVGQVVTLPPRAGEHTREILRELGYSPERIGELVESAVVEVP